MFKYPRTRHIAGSRLQPGDEDLDALPFESIAGCDLVIEEKMDGANAAVSFGQDGVLLLQSRGHYLHGGPREKHFDLFKTWAARHQDALRAVLGIRFVMFGEWLYAKHTVFYDRLPHYFLEFDVLDREASTFLSTPRRKELLRGLPVESVPILAQGRFTNIGDVTAMLGPSTCKSSEWRNALITTASSVPRLDVERVTRETDPSDNMEGLYVKHEEHGLVIGRYKYVRASFFTTVTESDSHWHSRPIVPNTLAPWVDLFAEARP